MFLWAFTKIAKKHLQTKQKDPKHKRKKHNVWNTTLRNNYNSMIYIHIHTYMCLCVCVAAAAGAEAPHYHRPALYTEGVLFWQEAANRRLTCLQSDLPAPYWNAAAKEFKVSQSPHPQKPGSGVILGLWSLLALWLVAGQCNKTCQRYVCNARTDVPAAAGVGEVSGWGERVKGGVKCKHAGRGHWEQGKMLSGN